MSRIGLLRGWRWGCGIFSRCRLPA